MIVYQMLLANTQVTAIHTECTVNKTEQRYLKEIQYQASEFYIQKLIYIPCIYVSPVAQTSYAL